MKMWRDISATQVHQSLNPYQQYPPPPITANGGGNKWNVPGQRSSYSLPHPGHTQSNMRWQKPAAATADGSNGHTNNGNLLQNQPLSSSTRNLSHTPSFLHPSGAGGEVQTTTQRSASPAVSNNGPRQRPASMYDTPSSMGYHINGGGGAQQPQQQQKSVGGPPMRSNGGTLRQNAGELVSFEFLFI